MARLGGAGNKDLRQFLSKLERDHGCKVGITGATHVQITLPNGAKYVASYTSSDHRSVKNLKAALRKKGLRL